MEWKRSKLLSVTNYFEVGYSTLAGNGRRWTVVMCEPQGMAVAAGDNTGRILVWPQPLYSSTKSVYHWHSLPVSAITFSSSGESPTYALEYVKKNYQFIRTSLSQPQCEYLENKYREGIP